MGQSLRVYLSTDERQYLEGLIGKGNHSSRLLRRARILLLAVRTGGKWNRYGKIAEVMHSDSSTVSNICRQYVRGGLIVALDEKPRPGRAPKMTGEIEALSVVLYGLRLKGVDNIWKSERTCKAAKQSEREKIGFRA